jgi:hypothetical protein
MNLNAQYLVEIPLKNIQMTTSHPNPKQTKE